jgi:alpha-L-fucosidase
MRAALDRMRALDGARGAKLHWQQTGVRSAVGTIGLHRNAAVSIAELREDIAHGQTVARYTLDGRGSAADWRTLSQGTTIGHCKLDRFQTVTVREVRLTIEGVVDGHPAVGLRLLTT